MVHLGVFTDKLASGSRRAFVKAEQEAHRLGHSQITPEHLLSAIAGLQRPLFDDVLMRLNRDSQTVLEGIEATLAGYKIKKELVGVSKEMRLLLHHSIIQAHDEGRRNLAPKDFLQVYCRRKQSKESLFGKLKSMFGSHG